MPGSPVRYGVGTYGPREVLRRRKFSRVMRDFLLGRPLIAELPGRDASQADVDAVRAGESRIVACYLRGNFESYPRRVTAGKLRVSTDSITWTPFIRFPWRHAVGIDFRVLCVQTRPPGIKEFDIPSGEKLRDGVMVPKWTVVTAKKPGIGAVDFVLPTPDVQLVTAWLTGEILGPLRPRSSCLSTPSLASRISHTAMPAATKKSSLFTVVSIGSGNGREVIAVAIAWRTTRLARLRSPGAGCGAAGVDLRGGGAVEPHPPRPTLRLRNGHARSVRHVLSALSKFLAGS